MSTIIPLAAGTKVLIGGQVVTLKSAANFEFPVNSLDAIAEILAASRKDDPSGGSVSNLQSNVAALHHTIVAGGQASDPVAESEHIALTGYAAGTPLDVTYGPNGERILTESPSDVPTYYYYY